jgi:hypothetical protein
MRGLHAGVRAELLYRRVRRFHTAASESSLSSRREYATEIKYSMVARPVPPQGKPSLDLLVNGMKLGPGFRAWGDTRLPNLSLWSLIERSMSSQCYL